MDLLPPLPLLAAFCLASVVLAVTPGPGVFYIVARSLAQGRAAGLASVAGVALGNLGNAVGASIGLAALFAVSSFAFSVARYAGAAYLVYLGISALRGGRTPEAGRAIVAADKGQVFRDGLVVALLNPKTTLFFAAFLPQFMSDAGSVPQSIALGGIFVLIAAITDSGYALACSLIAPRLQGMQGAARTGRWMSAAAYVGLGLFTAFTGTREAR
jgi:threonine/homoserine/homoserine lactone efflux protein